MDQVRYDTEFALIHAPVSKDQPVDWAKIADDEFANKRINCKILKHRAQPKHQFEAEEFKQTAMEQMAKSADVASFRESVNRSIRSSRDSKRPSDPASPRVPDQAPKVGRRSGQESPTYDRGDTGLTEAEEQEALEAKREQQKAKLEGREKRNAEKEAERQRVMAAKLTDERTHERQGKIGAILAERQAKKETPSFVSEYFRSNGGETFLSANPPDPPSEEMLTRMRQRIERNRPTKPNRDANASGMDNGQQSIKGS